ncbi:inorganic phosphate transporter [Bacteroidia bacterium]|nr:inorganic phosphate transporter [Bacteroidia bacterium]GHV70866.1 inorganic phosphate transporter [Bacteroidia bacterium]
MVLLIIVIILALIFDYINGFHDAANSIATIVSTKVLTPFRAVLWAAFFNFVAFFIAKYIIGEFGIANTVSKTIFENFITLPVILSGLLAAIAWNLLTWWLGIPSSSSHTLIGGFMGAAIASVGNIDVVHWVDWIGVGGKVNKGVVTIAAFIILAPLIGMIVSVLFTSFVFWVCRNVGHHKANRWFKRLQLVSSGLFSIGHGLNDSQKVMGIIGAALIAATNDASIANIMPEWMHMHSIKEMAENNSLAWVPFTCFTVIALGTMSGGWRIIKTMGSRITKVTPLEGVVAETSGAITLFLTEILKIPVSTTHTITGAIMGVGAFKRLSAVRWGITINLLWAWILTIPVSALLAALIYPIIRLIVG